MTVWTSSNFVTSLYTTSTSARFVIQLGLRSVVREKQTLPIMEPSCPIYIAVPLGVLFVLIVMTNSCVCLLVYLYTNLRTYTNGLVVSLAVSDILTGALVLPLYIADVQFDGTGYIVSAIMLTGVANQCAVTLDRYLAIKRPFIYHAVMAKHFSKLIAACWVLPVVISIIPLVYNLSTVDFSAHRIYIFLMQGLCVIVPYIFIFTAYYQIYQQARLIVQRIRRESSLSWRSEDRKTGKKISKDPSSEAKVAKMFSVIAFSFILSWLPVIYLTSVLAAVKHDIKLADPLSPLWLQHFSLFTIALGSMVNPIIYSFFKPDFRRILKKLFRKAALKRKQKNHIFTNLTSVAEKLETGSHGQETDV